MQPNFIDVSHHQQAIDWRRVVASGIKGVYIKATNGAYNSDDRYPVNAQGAFENKIPFGAYHFLLSDQDGVAQADRFLDRIYIVAPEGLRDRLCPMNLIPVVDIEWDTRRQVNGHPEPDRWLAGKNPEQSLARRTEIIGDFILRVIERIDVCPVIYTSLAWWRPMMGLTTGYEKGQASFKFSDCELWIARYGPSPDPLPAPWSDYAIWQFSGSGHLGGINTTVDLDFMKCAIEELTLAPTLHEGS